MSDVKMDQSTNDTGVNFDPAIHVNAELHERLPMFEQMTAYMQLSTEVLAGFRQGAEQFALPVLPEILFEEHTILGGAADVRVFVINQVANRELRPAILYIHGGGFVMGSAKASLRNAQDLAKDLDCVVVSVEYRLAPETMFPGALEDNYTALKWLYDNAADLGVDNSRIAIMGESAGGGHAAMLAIAVRDRAEIPVVFQALLYPMLDDRTGSTRAVPQHIGTLLWTAKTNQFGWSSLLGVPAGSNEVPAGAVPARVENLRGLPPTFIGVGSIDLFLREDTEYALRLNEAGVCTELYVAPGAFHGFDVSSPEAAIAKTLKTALYGAFARAFKNKS